MKADIHIILDDDGNIIKEIELECLTSLECFRLLDALKDASAPIWENIDKNSNDAGETKVEKCDCTN